MQSNKTSLARIMNSLLMSASAQAAAIIPFVAGKQAAIDAEEAKHSPEAKSTRKALRKRTPFTHARSRRQTESGHLHGYASEADAGRAMRRAQRWLRANPNATPSSAPRHIWEKLSAMSEALA